MTWTDEHGVIHLVHQLPEEVWQQLDEGRRNIFGVIGVMSDDEIKAGDMVFISGAPSKIYRAEYPRYQTYCGEARFTPGDSPGAPTCIECAKIDALIDKLASRGIPWWR